MKYTSDIFFSLSLCEFWLCKCVRKLQMAIDHEIFNSQHPLICRAQILRAEYGKRWPPVWTFIQRPPVWRQRDDRTSDKSGLFCIWSDSVRKCGALGQALLMQICFSSRALLAKVERIQETGNGQIETMTLRNSVMMVFRQIFSTEHAFLQGIGWHWKAVGLLWRLRQKFAICSVHGNAQNVQLQWVKDTLLSWLSRFPRKRKSTNKSWLFLSLFFRQKEKARVYLSHLWEKVKKQRNYETAHEVSIHPGKLFLLSLLCNFGKQTHRQVRTFKPKECLNQWNSTTKKFNLFRLLSWCRTMHAATKEKPTNFPCHMCDKVYKVKHRYSHGIVFFGAQWIGSWRQNKSCCGQKKKSFSRQVRIALHVGSLTFAGFSLFSFVFSLQTESPHSHRSFTKESQLRWVQQRICQWETFAGTQNQSSFR